MCFVDNHKPYRIKRLGVILTRAHGLNHTNDKVVFNVKRVLLDSTDGCSRTKLLNSLLPLICQKFFVDYYHRTNLEMCRICECHRCLTKTRRERQYTTAYFPKRLDTGSKRLVLSRRVPEGPVKLDRHRHWFLAFVDGSIVTKKPWNVQ